jgi:hypothetical protein
VAADSSWNYKIVSDPNLDGIYSDISGDYLIYSGSIGDAILQNSTRVIQLYSLSTGEQTRIATSDQDSILTGEGINGNYAVWFSEAPLDSTTNAPNKIFLYSIAEKNLTPIRTGSGVEWPKVSGERVIWSESVNDSFADSIMRYDIRTGDISLLPDISVNDGSAVGFNGKYILYSDANTMKLLLYSTGTGSTTTVFAPAVDNNTHEMVFGTALGNDYVLYRKDVMVEKTRERYSELCLYTISTGKTTLLSPNTGNIIETLSGSDKQASFDALSSDGTRVAWMVAEGIGNDRIMVLDLATMAVSSVSPKTFVNFIHLDSRNMTWLGSGSIAGKGSIYLATESGVQALPATTEPTRAPGFGLIITAGGLLVGVFLARKMH